MCYAKPGPRCQGHAAEKVQDSTKRLYDALPEEYKQSNPKLKQFRDHQTIQQQKIVEAQSTFDLYSKASADLTSINDSVRSGKMSEAEAIQSIKDSKLPMDVSTWEHNDVLPIERLVSFVSRITGGTQDSVDSPPPFSSALAQKTNFYANAKSEAAKEVKSLNKGQASLQKNLDNYKVHFVDYASKDLTVLSDPKLGKLAEEYSYNKKELNLTSGYRRDLKKKADTSLESGDIPAFNKRMDEYDSLQAEYSIKYGAWEKARKRDKPAVVASANTTIAEHDTVVNTAAPVLSKQQEKQKVKEKALQRQAEANTKLGIKSPDVDFDVEF